MVVVAAAVVAGCTSSSSGPAATSSPPPSSSTVPSGAHIEGATPAAAPFEAFEQVRVTIVSSDGHTRTPCMLLARTEARRNQGLMHVADAGLHGYAGMVFAFDTDVTGSFTMQDTLIPLSVVFLDAAGHPVSTTAMQPCPAGAVTCPTYPAPQPYRSAIEVPAGQVGPLGLTDGATVTAGGACHTSSP